jgi:hypothetical protein
MSDTTKSLRPLVNRAPCWESEHEPVITFFTDDGDEWGEDILSVELILPPSPPPAASGDKGKKRPDE